MHLLAWQDEDASASTATARDFFSDSEVDLELEPIDISLRHVTSITSNALSKESSHSSVPARMEAGRDATTRVGRVLCWIVRVQAVMSFLAIIIGLAGMPVDLYLAGEVLAFGVCHALMVSPGVSALKFGDNRFWIGYGLLHGFMALACIGWLIASAVWGDLFAPVFLGVLILFQTIVFVLVMVHCKIRTPAAFARALQSGQASSVAMAQPVCSGTAYSSACGGNEALGPAKESSTKCDSPVYKTPPRKNSNTESSKRAPDTSKRPSIDSNNKVSVCEEDPVAATPPKPRVLLSMETQLELARQSMRDMVSRSNKSLRAIRNPKASKQPSKKSDPEKAGNNISGPASSQTNSVKEKPMGTLRISSTGANSSKGQRAPRYYFNEQEFEFDSLSGNSPPRNGNQTPATTPPTDLSKSTLVGGGASQVSVPTVTAAVVSKTSNAPTTAAAVSGANIVQKSSASEHTCQSQ